jgi:SagB-type dehydrogenase family enzyme
LILPSTGNTKLTHLASGGTGTQLQRADPELTDDVAEFLDAAGMLERDGGGSTTWTVPELAFHANSRRGRHDAATGAVYPLPAGIPPAVDTRTMSGPFFELGRNTTHPVLTLGDALRRRATSRSAVGLPPTIDALAALLDRTQRVRTLTTVRTQVPDGFVDVEYAPRGYANGGSLYELEILLIAGRDFEPGQGIYRYDALRHGLWRIDEHGLGVQRPLRLVITGRIARRAWKYALTAYANMLKNAGVLVESLRLNGLALGLECWFDPNGVSDLVGLPGLASHEEPAVSVLEIRSVQGS